MTVLQALEVLEEIANSTHFVHLEDGDGYFDAQEEPNFSSDDSNIKKLRDYLTPPTSEEVCEELERYFYQCVGKANPYIKYIKDLKQFVYVDGDKYYEVVALDKNGYISFKTSLPSYLIELIGRFYGAQK